MIPRKIQAPGVEVNEIDVSQYNTINFEDNTVVLLHGFSDKGDDNVTKIVTSMEDFTNTYGYPTTEAERYLYNGVKQTILYGGIPAVTKLPYKNNSTEKFSCFKYKIGNQVENFQKVCDVISVENLFYPFSGFDYNVNNINDVVNNINSISKYLDQETNDFQEIEEILNWLQNENEKLELTANLTDFYDLEDITNSLYDINLKIYGEPSLSDLNNCEQVILFENFIKGIVSFESYDIEKSVLDDINNLLFGRINCFYNLRNILELGEQGYFQDLDKNNAKSVIYWIMKKSGYETYEKFLTDFSETLTKDQILKCIEDVKDTILSVDPEIEDNVLSLEYSDIARLDGMDTFVRIEADTSSDNYLSFSDYDDMVIGNLVAGDPSITIVDITRSKYEKDKLAINENPDDKEYLGIVPVLVTAVNAIWYQKIIDRSMTDFKLYNIVSEISSTTKIVPESHVEIPISALSEHGRSLGEIAAGYFPKIDFISPKHLDNTLFQKVGIVVFKMGIDTANNNMISMTPVEAFVGSLNRKEKDLITNASDFLENIVNNQSQYINVFINISESLIKRFSENSTYVISNQPAFSLGFSSKDCEKNISVELMKKSIELEFDKLQNPNLLKIDVVADCGASNIAQYIANTSFFNVGKYEIADTYNFKIQNEQSISVWKQIINLYVDFCQNVRKDCMFIVDSPRNFCLLGNQKMVRRSNPSITVENGILPSLRYMVDFNTSYGAGYCNWFRCIDDTTRFYMWMPPTIKVIEAYLITDNAYNFWDAPAGLRRGTMSDTYDIAFNPSEKDAEKLYINRWNYAVSFPLEGIILEGQKTFQKNMTAFDRVNVRRLFLRVEKDVKRMARTFLYEPLTERNLARFRDMVNTYLQDIKTRDGINEFYVICDSRNNTVDTMENNEMHCSIGIRPVKTLEFIVLNFICTNQSANVEEVTSQYI